MKSHSVLVILIVSSLFFGVIGTALSFRIGFNAGKSVVGIQAVEFGYAEWIVATDGSVKFKWKEPQG